ncbi:MAG: hypothetical protein ACREUQ_16005 [Burkholderiales bacterium]
MATETETGYKEGNYVQGTVLMVLRKQTSDEVAFLGVREYQPLLASGQANRTRLKNASEFLRKDLGGEGFAASITRNVLFAVYRVADSGEAREGLRWLRDEIKPSYWDSRGAIIAILRYLGSLRSEHWKQDSEAAQLLAGTVDNDHV